MIVQLLAMQKTVLIISFILIFFQTYAQSNNDFLPADTIANASKKTNNYSISKTLIYTTCYAGGTLLCYRFLDTDIKEFAQANQNETVTHVANVVEQLG